MHNGTYRGGSLDCTHHALRTEKAITSFRCVFEGLEHLGLAFGIFNAPSSNKQDNTSTAGGAFELGHKTGRCNTPIGLLSQGRRTKWASRIYSISCRKASQSCRKASKSCRNASHSCSKASQSCKKPSRKKMGTFAGLKPAATTQMI